jgi:shikimate kinase
MQNSEINIFLVGMPSSGKSTLGRALALALHYEYVDMDELIVAKENKSIAQIFQDNGEEYFRRVESELLKSIYPNQKKLISTGGGVPVFFDNMEYILANGISIYLDVKPDDLFERITHSGKNDRPLIDKSNAEILMDNLKQKYQFRFPYYSKANILISNDFSIRHLMERLKEYNLA